MRLLRRQFAPSDRPPFPWALSFESGDYVNLGNVLNSIDQDTPFMIECLVRPVVYGQFMAIVSSQEAGPRGKGVQLGMHTNGRLLGRVQGEKRLERQTQNPLPENQWLHVGMRYGGGRTADNVAVGLRIILNGAYDPSHLGADEGEPGDMTTTQPTYLGVRNGDEIPFVGDMDEVRFWFGTIPVSAHFSHYMNRRVPTPYAPLFANHAKKFDASAFQGVATDGTNIYATDNTTLYKYGMDGTLVNSFSHGVAGFKNEDPTVVDGVIYVPLTNHPTTPRVGKLQKIDASDLSVIDTIDLAEDVWPASVAHREGEFWVSVTESDTIYVYDSDFKLQRSYTFNVLGAQRTDYPGYSGIEWIGDHLYGNKHEGQTTHQLDVCRYDAGRDELIAVGAFSYASSGTTQGMAYDAENQKVYWAARGHDNEVWESDLTGGLLGYWRLEEGQGTSVADATGNHADGMISGASWVYRRPN